MPCPSLLHNLNSESGLKFPVVQILVFAVSFKDKSKASSVLALETM